MFYVTLLDSTSAFVFGHNWLHCYNLSIDWTAGQLLYFQNSLHSVPMSPCSGPNGSPNLSAPSFSTNTSTWSVSDSVLLGNSSSSSSLLPSVSFINVAAYACLACLPGSTVFTVTRSASDSTTVCGFSAKAEPVNIPEEYHKFQDIFSKMKARNLVPYCPYDLKIDLEENAEPPLRWMYLLSEIKLLVLQTFLV